MHYNNLYRFHIGLLNDDGSTTVRWRSTNGCTVGKLLCEQERCRTVVPKFCFLSCGLLKSETVQRKVVFQPDILILKHGICPFYVVEGSPSTNNPVYVVRLTHDLPLFKKQKNFFPIPTDVVFSC